MFCWKCGKEIEGDSKFCPFCGANVREDENAPPEGARQDAFGAEPAAQAEQPAGVKEDAPEKKKKGKLIAIAAGIAAAVAVAVVIAVFALGGREKKEESAPAAKEQEEQSEPEKDTDSDIEKEEYPKEITLDAYRQAGLEALAQTLEWSILWGGSPYKDYSDAEKCCAFLMDSLWADDLVSGYPGVKTENYWYVFPTETLESYLKDSIGMCDLSEIKETAGYGSIEYDEDGTAWLSGGYCAYENDTFYAMFPDAGDNEVKDAVIQKVYAISDKDIRVEGSVQMACDGEVYETVSFQITFTENPDSVWGGYTMKEIEKWEVEQAGDSGDYVLPESDTRCYSEEELEDMDAHDLYLARNELYARHGYKFNNEDLQEFFGAKDWYEPRTKNVSESDFNEYEKANLELIQSLEYWGE